MPSCRRVLALSTFLLGAACASQPDEVGTAYVSHLHYKSFDCEQLEQEAERISRHALDLHARLKEKADTDEVQMGVGLVLFWPTLFFLEGGDGPQAQEYARLKGERVAIEKASIHKKCPIVFPPIVPPKKKDEGDNS